MEKEFDLVIIGSGPGGYVAAIRAGQMGLKTAIVEKNKMGGMCLNWGCIPTKALLESGKRFKAVKEAATFGIDGIETDKLSFNWKTAKKRSDRIVRRLTKGVEFLVKKNGVQIITGEAVINADKSVSVENRLLSTKNILLATGSKPGTVSPAIPPLMVLEVFQFLKEESLPQHPVVWGNGPHAVELAQFLKLAGKEVTLLTDKALLIPNADPFISQQALKNLKKEKINVVLEAKVNRYQDGQLILEGQEEVTIPCDKVINGAERVAVVPQLDLEDEMELENSFIKVNENLLTSIENIYAVGDVNGNSIFAHAASVQALHAVNHIKGIKNTSTLAAEKYPVNIYTSPEMAQVGLTEPQVQLSGQEYKVNEFPLTANGKALTEGNTDGIVRIISEPKYGEVLGVQIIAPNATDMIAEASVLMQLEGTVFDVAGAVHAHPTVSEVFMEAGFDAFDQPIHK